MQDLSIKIPDEKYDDVISFLEQHGVSFSAMRTDVLKDISDEELDIINQKVSNECYEKHPELATEE